MASSDSKDRRLSDRSEDTKTSPGHREEAVFDQEKQGIPVVKGYKGKSDPFAGDELEGHTKYRSMEWWQAGMVMIAETISVGILSLPSVLATVGFVPGMILILGLGAVATYSGYVLGQFKLRYPHIHNMADAGEIILGPIGREIFGAGQLLFLIFICSSHILTFSIMMNTLTDHGTCTIVFGLVGAIVMFLLSVPRTLKSISYFCIVSFISIIAAVTVTMIGVGVERPDTNIHAFQSESFAPAFLATTNIIFAYAGHVSFFGFISELREPTSYPKALYLLQTADTTMYLIVAAIIYTYAGDSVASPALGSASPVVAKVAFGVAIPTIVIAGVTIGNVATKYVYVRLFRGTGFMVEKSLRSYGVWTLILFVVWLLAWIIAEAIPVFNDLLGLISAIFASWFTYGLSGVFWLYLNWGQYTKNWKKMILTAVNLGLFVMGCAIFGIGLYASGTAIHADAAKAHGSFTCADNR